MGAKIKYTESERDSFREMAHNSQRYFPIDETGDLFLEYFVKDHWGKRLAALIPSLNRTYDLLVERGNIGSKNRFGKMCGDRYLYVFQHNDNDDKRMMVSQTQSRNYIYMWDSMNYHVRELYSQESPKCPRLTQTNVGFGGFPFSAYADGRDDNYILSVSHIDLRVGDKHIYNVTCDHVLTQTRWAIEFIEVWMEYIDDPSLLF
jgi:hypothetical protein